MVLKDSVTYVKLWTKITNMRKWEKMTHDNKVSTSLPSLEFYWEVHLRLETRPVKVPANRKDAHSQVLSTFAESDQNMPMSCGERLCLSLRPSKKKT